MTVRHHIGPKYRGSRGARPNEYGDKPARRTAVQWRSQGCPQWRAPVSAELAGRGRCAGGERAAALGVGRDEPSRRRRRHEPDGKLGRRRRHWRRAGQVPGDACRAVRLIVNVMAPLARLLDMRAQTGRRARLGKGNHDRDEKLDQTEQRERHNGRPRSRADGSRRSLCSVGGRIHWVELQATARIRQEPAKCWNSGSERPLRRIDGASLPSVKTSACGACIERVRL